MVRTRPVLVIGNRNYSSWSLRAWLVLTKARFDFDVVRIALFAPGYRESLRRHSPTGKVPVLHDGEVTVWESLAIAEYAAEHAAARGSMLWPHAAAARAHARALAAEMHAGFSALRESLPMNCRARDRKVPSTPAVAADIARVVALIEDCRSRHAHDGPWLFGAFSVADAMYVPVITRFLTYGVGFERDLLREYADTVLADADVAAWYDAARAESETVSHAEIGEETRE